MFNNCFASSNGSQNKISLKTEKHPKTKHGSESSQWIGLRKHLQETPIFNGKNHGFLWNFP